MNETIEDAWATIRSMALDGYASSFGKTPEKQIDAIIESIFKESISWAVKMVVEASKAP